MVLIERFELPCKSYKDLILDRYMKPAFDGVKCENRTHILGATNQCPTIERTPPYIRHLKIDAIIQDLKDLKFLL